MKVVSLEDQTPYPRLDREELIILVDKIMSGEGTEEEVCYWVALFESNVPHPSGADLIFYPEKEPETAEEVVDIALSSKPISL